MRSHDHSSRHAAHDSPPSAPAHPPWLQALLREAHEGADTPAPTVLLRIASPSLREETKERLAALGYQPRLAAGAGTPAPGQAEDHDGPVAVVTDDEYLAAPARSGALTDDRRRSPQDGQPCILLHLGSHADSPDRRQPGSEWASLTTPVSTPQLQTSLSGALGARAPRPLRFLLAGNTTTSLADRARALEERGAECRLTGVATLCRQQDLAAFGPDLLLMEDEVPSPALAREIRERQLAGLPVVMLAGEGPPPPAAPAIDPDLQLPHSIESDTLRGLLLHAAQQTRRETSLRHQLAATEHARRREWRAVDQHAIVSATDAQGTIVHVNDRFAHVSGYAREELLGANHRLLKSDRHPASFYRELWETIGSGHSWSGVICNRRKDGELYWVRSTITPILDSRGRPQAYISVRTDITPLKQAEERLRLLERAVESNPSGLVIADASREGFPLIYVNRGFEEMTGYPAAEVLERPCHFLQRDDRDQPGSRELASALASGRSAAAILQNYRRSGTPFWNEVVLSPIHDDQGVVTHYVGIQQDVTDRV